MLSCQHPGFYPHCPPLPIFHQKLAPLSCYTTILNPCAFVSAFTVMFMHTFISFTPIQQLASSEHDLSLLWGSLPDGQMPQGKEERQHTQTHAHAHRTAQIPSSVYREGVRMRRFGEAFPDRTTPDVGFISVCVLMQSSYKLKSCVQYYALRDRSL